MSSSVARQSRDDRTPSTTSCPAGNHHSPTNGSRNDTTSSSNSTGSSSNSEQEQQQQLQQQQQQQHSARLDSTTVALRPNQSFLPLQRSLAAPTPTVSSMDDQPRLIWIKPGWYTHNVMATACLLYPPHIFHDAQIHARRRYQHPEWYNHPHNHPHNHHRSAATTAMNCLVSSDGYLHPPCDGTVASWLYNFVAEDSDGDCFMPCVWERFWNDSIAAATATASASASTAGSDHHPLLHHPSHLIWLEIACGDAPHHHRFWMQRRRNVTRAQWWCSHTDGRDWDTTQLDLPRNGYRHVTDWEDTIDNDNNDDTGTRTILVVRRQLGLVDAAGAIWRPRDPMYYLAGPLGTTSCRTGTVYLTDVTPVSSHPSSFYYCTVPSQIAPSPPSPLQGPGHHTTGTSIQYHHPQPHYQILQLPLEDQFAKRSEPPRLREAIGVHPRYVPPPPPLPPPVRPTAATAVALAPIHAPVLRGTKRTMGETIDNNSRDTKSRTPANKKKTKVTQRETERKSVDENEEVFEDKRTSNALSQPKTSQSTNDENASDSEIGDEDEEDSKTSNESDCEEVDADEIANPTANGQSASKLQQVETNGCSTDEDDNTADDEAENDAEPEKDTDPCGSIAVEEKDTGDESSHENDNDNENKSETRGDDEHGDVNVITSSTSPRRKNTHSKRLPESERTPAIVSVDDDGAANSRATNSTETATSRTDTSATISSQNDDMVDSDKDDASVNSLGSSGSGKSTSSTSSDSSLSRDVSTLKHESENLEPSNDDEDSASQNLLDAVHGQSMQGKNGNGLEANEGNVVKKDDIGRPESLSDKTEVLPASDEANTDDSDSNDSSSSSSSDSSSSSSETDSPDTVNNQKVQGNVELETSKDTVEDEMDTAPHDENGRAESLPDKTVSLPSSHDANVDDSDVDDDSSSSSSSSDSSSSASETDSSSDSSSLKYTPETSSHAMNTPITGGAGVYKRRPLLAPDREIIIAPPSRTL